MEKRQFHVLVEWDQEDQVWVTFVPALNGLAIAYDRLGRSDVASHVEAIGMGPRVATAMATQRLMPLL